MRKLFGRHSQAFIGRDEPLEQIDQLIQSIRQGEPRICLIQGEAGVGKTRFLKEIESVAQANGLQFYKGRCFEDLT